MSLTIFRARAIRVGASVGFIIPKDEVSRWNIEIGDLMRIDIDDIDRSDRKNYQSKVERKRTGKKT